MYCARSSSINQDRLTNSSLLSAWWKNPITRAFQKGGRIGAIWILGRMLFHGAGIETKRHISWSHQITMLKWWNLEHADSVSWHQTGGDIWRRAILQISKPILLAPNKIPSCRFFYGKKGNLCCKLTTAALSSSPKHFEL